MACCPPMVWHPTEHATALDTPRGAMFTPSIPIRLGRGRHSPCPRVTPVSVLWHSWPAGWSFWPAPMTSTSHGSCSPQRNPLRRASCRWTIPTATSRSPQKPGRQDLRPRQGRQPAFHPAAIGRNQRHPADGFAHAGPALAPMFQHAASLLALSYSVETPCSRRPCTSIS